MKKVIILALTMTTLAVSGVIPHPFDLQPTEIITAYFLHNEIPFSSNRAD